MKLVAKNNEHAFTFTTGESVVFVQSQSFVKDVEEGHCADHAQYMSGCSACEAFQYIKTFDSEQFEKLPFRSLTIRKGAITAPLEIQIGNQSPKIQLIRQQLARALAVFFAKEKNKAAKAAAEKYKEIEKANSSERDIVIAYAAYNAIQWNLLINAVKTDLLAAAQAGAEEGLSQLGESSEELKQSINATLEEYAEDRAAEMVGKKYIGQELVDDPAAKFVISESTRDDLEDLVSISLDKNESVEQMVERIISASTFNDIRSQLISKNETAMAQVKGHLAAWYLSNKVKRVGIKLSDAHTEIDECDDLAAKTYLISECPVIPAHPNCMCTVIATETEKET